MREERLAIGGAILAAIASGVCCVTPLLFVLLGLGAFGAAHAFEVARPYMLGAAVLFLAYGFYRTYFRRAQSCAPGEACATKPVNRMSRALLWIGMAAVVAFALSPYYAGTLASRLSAKPAVMAGQMQSATQQPAVAQAKYKVTGMDCASCETTIRLALEKTQGVSRAEVSYGRGEALVEYDPNVTTPEKLRDAITGTGYQAEIKR
jgi:mercuric ion transport protein